MRQKGDLAAGVEAERGARHERLARCACDVGSRCAAPELDPDSVRTQCSCMAYHLLVKDHGRLPPIFALDSNVRKVSS